MDNFIDGYRRFRETYFREREGEIRELMRRPQKPQALMIACSDSRIDPSLKFGAAPGDLFMVRNVANLVPPYEPDSHAHGTSAAVEFAVNVLEVQHAIVMGHAKCGGIDALLNRTQVHGEFIDPWMQTVAEAREHALAGDRVGAQRRCEQEAVKISVRNLLAFPWVRSRVEAGKLAVHGWYFDLETAGLYQLDEAGEFKPV